MRKFIAISATIISIFLLFGCSQQKVATPQSTSSKKQVTVTLTLKEDNQQFATKTIKVAATSSIEDALKKVYTVKKEKDMITSIDGRKQDAAKSKYWLYTINGKTADKYAAETTVKNKAVIVFNLAAIN